MPTNGMTIDSLNTVSSLTAQDEVPVWDKEASSEPTKKITAQNMANSVKSLASLPNTTEMNTAIDQSTADVIRTGDVVNSLTSTATNAPLSAAQGKELNDKIGNLFATVTALNPARSGDVISGGYIKVGKAVIVSFKLTLASNISANTSVVSNSQNANIPGSVCLSGYADTYGKRGNLFMLRDYIGTLITNTDMEAGNYVFCGCYIAE